MGNKKKSVCPYVVWGHIDPSAYTRVSEYPQGSIFTLVPDDAVSGPYTVQFVFQSPNWRANYLYKTMDNKLLLFTEQERDCIVSQVGEPPFYKQLELDLGPDLNPVFKVINNGPELKCECGSSSLGVQDSAPGHSNWCPVSLNLRIAKP